MKNFLFAGALLALTLHAQDGVSLLNGRRSVVLENPAARLAVDLAGGSLGEFRLKAPDMNPLSWSTPKAGDTKITGFGHFLCLDRWGPPTKAEGDKGMPYHGEAAHVQWLLVSGPTAQEAFTEAQMTAKLPLAGLSIRRTVRMSKTGAIATVREEVTNDNPLGRIYNAVQHATIGPPFLDETTIVDSNGRNGFSQDGPMPNPESISSEWPNALKTNGSVVNLRHLTNDPNPNVVSFAIEDDLGWVTAVTPGKGVLIGYLWKKTDYPWVSVWREVRAGKPSARGLEFGTTGLHQPYPVLVKKGQIWDRPLYQYLDAGETSARSYTMFLLNVPTDFSGVEGIKLEGTRLILKERTTGKPRELTLDATGLVN